MKRPRAITVFCIIGYVIVLLSFLKVFSPDIKKLGMFMPAIYGIIVAASFMAYVGIWHFKQWGVELFLIALFARLTFFLLIKEYSFGFYFNLLFSLSAAFTFLRFYRKMSPNL